ncbi:hypothetical protein NON08_03020 [Cetobacterium somerae]|uniref:hypothetical protein n=1 Tax=Cetobacterium sp. NK01 TaxID=2993530 RepID=UPI002116D8C4|nr:hypothetical protein [Cetobacterium sp. NK01]MCQ8211541.1 hypothetical protein [Cetobacterium sp. NK01]
MKSNIFFKIFTIIVTFIIGYFLYEHINILKNEYLKRENQKNLFLEKIDKTYKERDKEFYKSN